MKNDQLPRQEITKRKNGSLRIQLHFDAQPSMAQQQFKEETDVNFIVSKYQQTGQILSKARSEGIFADVSQIGSFHEALQNVTQATQAFEALPSGLRLRFGNDPQQMLNFLHDPNNYEEGVKLGLFEPPKKTNELNEQKPAAPTPSTPPPAEEKK